MLFIWYYFVLHCNIQKVEAKQQYEFLVIKRSYTFYTCNHCSGSGELHRKFRQMTFVEDCPKCKGEGRVRHSVTEEYPFIEAIQELQI